MIHPRKITLANIPTPIQLISFEGCKFLIKRDDLTGLELSGNKVRKLEYLLYEAKKQKANYIFTCGGEQSNHARATAVAAASQGFKSKLFLWGKDTKFADGNLFINKFIGSEFSFLNKKEYWNVNNIMENEKIKFAKAGEKVFIIPEGGSSELGIWGYVNFIDELKLQINSKSLKGIITAAGSGGTSAGLLVGAALNNLKLKIFSVNVLYSANEIREKILLLANSCIDKFKLNCKIDESQLEILDGFSEEGYKNISVEKIQLIKSFAKTSGIILDPAYTGKAFYAYQQHFLMNRKKSDILFVHTGGFLGVFGKKKKYLSA
ncbi:MAG: pyridoxal-phosphate dependent enzyme [Ignavibacteriales bacterium]|nr:pyridoxal-phosphate dependent enzyme [Ignavibacteriales bacterium]